MENIKPGVLEITMQSVGPIILFMTKHPQVVLGG